MEDFKMSILEVVDIKKTYTSRLGGSQVQALKGTSFTVEAGEFVAIMGDNVIIGLSQETSENKRSCRLSPIFYLSLSALPRAVRRTKTSWR
jgi:hypothetical protein